MAAAVAGHTTETVPGEAINQIVLERKPGEASLVADPKIDDVSVSVGVGGFVDGLQVG